MFENPWQALRNVLLLALTLGTYVSGIFARFLRASLLAELRADYVRTARAKGLKVAAASIRAVLSGAPVAADAIATSPPARAIT